MSETAAAYEAKGTTKAPALLVAFELGEQSWRLAFSAGLGEPVVERTVAPRNLQAVLERMAWAKRRLGLPPEAPVRSCYEAGREGFWLHRALAEQGVENLVVDSASLEVNRKKRRAKSDRIDVRGLLDLLIRHWAGGRKVWSVLRVPTVEEEDARHLHRELRLLKEDRARITNRIRGLLATMGLTVRSLDRVRLAELRRWDGSPLPPGLHGRLARYLDDRAGLSARIDELEKKRRQILAEGAGPPGVEQVRQLDRLRAVGTQSAWLLVMEFFGWRDFRNRRQVTGAAGLAPTPYDSGSQRREQGIGKDGNRWVRGLAVELAWAWLKHQPQSELARWYQRRFGHAGARMRKIGIVALARKLLIALWRFVETGVVPEGAELKPAVRVR